MRLKIQEHLQAKPEYIVPIRYWFLLKMATGLKFYPKAEKI